MYASKLVTIGYCYVMNGERQLNLLTLKPLIYKFDSFMM